MGLGQGTSGPGGMGWQVVMCSTSHLGKKKEPLNSGLDTGPPFLSSVMSPANYVSPLGFSVPIYQLKIINQVKG